MHRILYRILLPVYQKPDIVFSVTIIKALRAYPATCLLADCEEYLGSRRVLWPNGPFVHRNNEHDHRRSVHNPCGPCGILAINLLEYCNTAAETLLSQEIAVWMRTLRIEAWKRRGLRRRQ